MQKDGEHYELQRLQWQQAEEESDPTTEDQENSTVSTRQANGRNPTLWAAEIEMGQWAEGWISGEMESVAQLLVDPVLKGFLDLDQIPFCSE